MKHARWDYQAIQPWPTKRPHIARDAAEPERIFDDWAEHEAFMVEPLIPDDEPVMLVRAQDALFLPLLAFYRDRLVDAGASPDIVDAVRAHIDLAEQWQLDHQPKVPDLVQLAEDVDDDA